MKRYSAIVCFDTAIPEDVLLIHKLRPSWQTDHANFPGGKVEEIDRPTYDEVLETMNRLGSDTDSFHLMHAKCVVREIYEECGLHVDVQRVKLFCILQFEIPGSLEVGQCYFFVTRTNIYEFEKRESETPFVTSIGKVVSGIVEYRTSSQVLIPLKTLHNLPWLIMMAKQALTCTRNEYPLKIVEHS